MYRLLDTRVVVGAMKIAALVLHRAGCAVDIALQDLCAMTCQLTAYKD